MIDRKTAEAARRRAIQLDHCSQNCSCSRGGNAASCECTSLETERRACVKLWNEFCVQETNRLAAKDMRAHLAARAAVLAARAALGL
jgi:hypothetical protein